MEEDIYHLPIKTEWIENKIVITATKDDKLKVGDIIKTIDGKPAMDVLLEVEKTISGSPQLRRFRALNILAGKYDQGVWNISTGKYDQGARTELVIERDGKEMNLSCYNKLVNKSLFFNLILNRKYQNEKILEVEPGLNFDHQTTGYHLFMLTKLYFIKKRPEFSQLHYY